MEYPTYKDEGLNKLVAELKGAQKISAEATSKSLGLSLKLSERTYCWNLEYEVKFKGESLWFNPKEKGISPLSYGGIYIETEEDCLEQIEDVKKGLEEAKSKSGFEDYSITEITIKKGSEIIYHEKYSGKII